MNVTPAALSASAGSLSTTPGSPTTIAASATAYAEFVYRTLGSATTIWDAVLAARVSIGSSAPGTNPTITFSFTLDGTNWYNDVTYQVPITSTSTSYDYSYTPPSDQPVVGIGVSITNGTTNSITAYCQANSGSVA